MLGHMGALFCEIISVTAAQNQKPNNAAVNSNE